MRPDTQSRTGVELSMLLLITGAQITSQNCLRFISAPCPDSLRFISARACCEAHPEIQPLVSESASEAANISMSFYAVSMTQIDGHLFVANLQEVAKTRLMSLGAMGCRWLAHDL